MGALRRRIAIGRAAAGTRQICDHVALDDWLATENLPHEKRH
jgi:hypothetical protein